MPDALYGTDQPGQFTALHAEIARHYTGKVVAHGPTPLGVDWSCMPTQHLRFVQLLKVREATSPCTINDLGCGYGALLSFIGQRFPGQDIDYLGIDISQAMVDAARRQWDGREGARFETASEFDRVADYTVASGIFNVKLDQPEDAWIAHIQATLTHMRAVSRLGYAVNFLTQQPSTSRGEREIYRADPGLWRSFCEDVLGSQVIILSDYGMREHTLIARMYQASEGPQSAAS
ncbi:MAG: class I SAM-dependent methyltransferase [Ramlibacter sp.]|nr:class I SAM-dependent methyltransferase [Ramlibacter sp.]